MYKVFFNDRTAYLGDHLPPSGENEFDLLYRFLSIHELKKVINRLTTGEEIRKLYIYHPDLLKLWKEFRKCFKPVEAGGGLVFNSEGAFFTMKRRGVWDLPKGKLEKHEDFETAALREVEEETGLKKLIISQPLISTYHTYELRGKQILKRTQWFEMQYPGTEEPVLQSKEGITDYRWVKPKETNFMLGNSFHSILDVLSIRDLI